MNKDQVTGKVEQAAGRVKQGVGEAIGNQKLANQGLADQVKGAAKETWGNVKDAAAATADRHQKEAEHRANDARADIRAEGRDVTTTSMTGSTPTRQKSGTRPGQPRLHLVPSSSRRTRPGWVLLCRFHWSA